ncbi:MAG: putative toxin-antitoxin system toxin component, PIN family [Anaerolineae bacterium]|jgi:putative PIN family toxin of toxin-antitoxin system
MRVVPDTNILVAFLLTRGPTISCILDGWERGDFELLTSPALVAEVRRTLEKPALRERIRPEAAIALLEALEKDALMTPGCLELSGVTPDPDDDAVISCAVEGDADYIVSRDMHLLRLGEYEGIRIIDPTEFAQRLREGYEGNASDCR